MNQAIFKNVAITVAAIGTLVVLGDFHIRAMGGIFEVDNPTLFARLEPLWGTLACVVPGICVGLFATYRPVLLSSLVYTLGTLISFFKHGGNGSIAVGNVLPEHQFIPAILREIGTIVVIGIAMALIGMWLRRRLTIGWSDRGVSSSVSREEGR